MSRTRYIAQAGVIAAVYASLAYGHQTSAFCLLASFALDFEKPTD